MAGAQARRGGIDAGLGRALADVSAQAAAFANELLDFAEEAYARLPEHCVFDLPASSLRVGFSAPDYAALCKRVYLSRPDPAGCARKVVLAVLDYESLPHMPRWAVPSVGFDVVALAAALAERGLRGTYDGNYRQWSIYDPARGLGVQAMHAASLRPPWEPSFPLRLLVHWSNRTAERGFIHAGTLGHRGQGVLLVGAGGSGKSGTTLSGILNGLTSVGDDYISVRSSGGLVEAHPLLRIMKQDMRGLQRLGLEAGQGALAEPLNWQGKIEFDFEAVTPGARADRLALKAILMPHIARARASSFRPASAREAMLAMAPSSLYQLHGSWREDFGLIASIARALPAFHLHLSEDPAEIASAIRAFIEDKVG